MAKNFYNLDDVLSIPIEEVCEVFGVKVLRHGMCSIRPDEKYPSCKLYTKNPDGHDTFYDFGANVGGSVVDLVMFLNNTDRQGAFDFLGETFHLEPQNNTDYEHRNELTDAQYLKIGVYGDLATKNLDFDLERFSMESAQKYADKYHMTVNELRKQHPNFYTFKILMRRALPHVSNMRNSYYMDLYNHYLLAKSLQVSDPTALIGSSVEEFERQKKELMAAEKLLYKAAKGTSLEERLTVRKYDVKEDYRALIDGKISFQVGPTSYNDIKFEASKQDATLCYHSVPMEDYFFLKREFLENVPHAAFMRAGTVNIACLPEQSLEIERSIDLLPTKHHIDELVKEASAAPLDSEKGKGSERSEAEAVR